MTQFSSYFTGKFPKWKPFFVAGFVGFLVLIMNFPVHGQELTVMTYNIYHGEHAENPGKSNLDEVAALIEEHQPDLVALQEVDSMTRRSAGLVPGGPVDQVQELAGMTGMHGYFGKAITFDGGGYGLGILSRSPGDASVHELPLPEGGEGRSLITLKTSLSGAEFVFAGTHLCHASEMNRLAQAKAICNILNDQDVPVIIGGDFNFIPGSTSYKAIRKCFRDASADAGKPLFTYPSGAPEKRIDYVFFSGNIEWQVANVELIHSTASDHSALLVTFTLLES